jgi:DNA-binding NarL/FixJ family response regulator
VTGAGGNGRTIRVLLADDHRLMREGLRHMLEREADFEVLPDAPEGRTAVRLAAELRPDVIVMDVTMPDLNGIEATRQIKASHPTMRVLGLSMHADRQFVTEMLAVGASGYLLKDCPANELATAIRAAAAGETYLSSKVAGLVLMGVPGGQNGDTHEAKRHYGSLTPREREILQLVADGGSSKEIAFRLGLSVKTVDTHRRQVMEKLQLYSVAELTHYAIREGLTALH